MHSVSSLNIYFTYFLDLLVFCCCSLSTYRFHCCVFRDALPHTTVVRRGYLRYCHLPVSFEQSRPSPLTSLNNNTFLPK